MNNSIVKLEDFELDEISGGITAKKGTISAVLGFGGMLLTFFVDKILTDTYGATTHLHKLADSLNLVHIISGCAIYGIPETLWFVAGWTLGELICGKIGLEEAVSETNGTDKINEENEI